MDTSFIDLTKDENIKKIKIDERLIPAFKKTMRNFQECFNRMGYIDSRDYKEFFYKNLISEYPIKNISILCNNKPLKDNAVGLYNYYKNRITIDNSILDEPTEVLDSLTHEFIHFLVMHNVRNNKIQDSIIDEQYLNESLTEMLKMKILPLTNQSYLPYILIIKFWLLLNNIEMDFNIFLNKGTFYKLDLEFKELLENYWNSLEESEHITKAMKNKYYINIQRFLINDIIININDLNDYELLISKLAKRPIEDNFFMNKYYKKIETRLFTINNIQEKYRNKYLIYLKQFRELVEILSNDNNFKYKDTFIFDESKFEIDYKRNLYIDYGFENKALNIILDGGYDVYKIKVKKEINKNLVLSNKSLKISKPRHILINNKRKELLQRKKEYLKSVLYYIKFINDNSIIEEKNIFKIN